MISIHNASDLIAQLCKTHEGDIELDLDPTDTFIIDADAVKVHDGIRDFCMCKTSHSLLIHSSSESSARIVCKGKTGFIFNNVSNLTFQWLSFTNCGALLTDVKINSSFFLFTNHQLAALVFVGVENITFDHVSIKSHGFAAIYICHNLKHATFDAVYVTSSLQDHDDTGNYPIGSGILLLFDSSNTNSSCVIFNNSEFTRNIDNKHPNLQTSCNCVIDLHHKESNKRMPILNAAALTILYSQKQYAGIQISNSTFSFNDGSIAGGILILHLYYAKNVGTQLFNSTITTSTFKRNEHSNLLTCAGSAISVIVFFQGEIHVDCNNCTALTIKDSTFQDHNQSEIDLRKNGIDDGENGILFVGIVTPPRAMKINIELIRLKF